MLEDPDVLTFQEVRLDTTFTSPDGKILNWYSGEEGLRTLPSNFVVDILNLREVIYMVGKYRIDGGSQVEHLLGHLAAAWTRKVGKDLAARNRYQVVFHPAMSMIDMFDNIYTNFHSWN